VVDMAKDMALHMCSFQDFIKSKVRNGILRLLVCVACIGLCTM
jgi:hypothetical protein